MATTPELVQFAEGVDARLSAEVAAMNVDQRIDRAFEIADSSDTSDEATLEAVKLLCGPDAMLAK